MEQLKPTMGELFEPAIEFPDTDMLDRFRRLVGLDEVKDRLTKILGLLVNEKGIRDWADKFHPEAKSVVSLVTSRPPLVILAGDVGAGKSELAYTIGDAVARQEDIAITLLPLSLSTRGQGMVGQMTRLVSAAFDHTIEVAKKLQANGKGKARGAVILLVDEADALAQSRESGQMHHEDKAGVNAFIRGIDRLGNGRLPAAVIMCTNRPDALDPAIRRRAADLFVFGRPNTEQREAVLYTRLAELGLSDKEIHAITELTGGGSKNAPGFTFSDLTQRLLPTILLDAYPSKAVSGKRAIEITKSIQPTPPFKESII
jgi:AAA+ superfamily predicted ATPase